MSKKFAAIIPYVLGHEGGYVDHPSDPGGETKYGITKRNYPELDIRHLSEADAISIYRRDYWRSWMDLLPVEIAAKVFDMCVNMGHTQAIKLMQRAAGCVEDGSVGPVTLASIKVRSPQEMVNNLVTVQRGFYTRLAERKPEMQVFLKGWLNRANWTPEVSDFA